MTRRLRMLICLSALIGLLLLPGCGGHGSSVARPLYVMTDDGKQMYLDVLSRDNATIADKIDLGSVHDAPPAGGIGLASKGYVLVTNTASLQGSSIVVESSTRSCAVLSGSCSSVVSVGGSDTVDHAGRTFAVPLYQGSDPFNGKIALINDGAPPKISHIVPLPKGWFPGPVALAPGGESLYWITAKPPPDPTVPLEYHLLEYDLSAQRVTHQVDFGPLFPGDLAVAPNGDVFVAITFARQGSQNPPSEPKPGNTVEVYSADLTHSGTIQVAEQPFQLRIGGPAGATLAIGYRDKGAPRIDLASTTNLSVSTSVALPSGTFTTRLISRLSSGDFALVLGINVAQFRVEIISSLGGQPTSRDYQGHVDSGVAG